MSKHTLVQTIAPVLFTLTAAGLIGQAQAAPVTVLNPSFELVGGVDQNDTSNSALHDNWSEDNANADARTRSVGENDGGTGLRPAADQDVWFTLDTRNGANGTSLGGIYQNVGTITADTLYTLDVLVGERSDNPTPGGVGASGADVRWGLYTGSPGSFTALSTLTASTDLSATMKANNGVADSEDMSVMWNSTGSGLAGQNLFIRFFTLSPHSSNSTSQILFDNVRLDASAAPIPTPAALPAGLAMLTALTFKRPRCR